MPAEAAVGHLPVQCWTFGNYLAQVAHQESRGGSPASDQAWYMWPALGPAMAGRKQAVSCAYSQFAQPVLPAEGGCGSEGAEAARAVSAVILALLLEAGALRAARLGAS